MKNKYTIDDMKILASKKGGDCLSIEYKNIRTKLIWKCSKEHVWEALPKNIVEGHWCRICSSHQYSISDMERIANSKNGQCLSECYSGIFGSLQWKCSRGHVWECSAKSVVAGHWCAKCAAEDRKIIHNDTLSTEKLIELCKIAELKGGRCLSEKYINSKMKLDLVCAKGHLWQVIPQSLKKGSWCPMCANENRTIKNNQSLINKKLEEVSRLCEINNITFISDKFDDINKKYTWKCMNCSYIFERTLEKMKVSKGCPKCARKKANIKIMTHSLEEMKELAKSRNGECLSAEYINCDTKLMWKCNICNNVWQNTPTMILAGQWCPKCSIEKRKKINVIGYQEQKIKEMQILANSRGGKCLSNTYLGCSYKLNWECSKGHTWDAKPSNIKTGTWCPICNGSPKLTIADMRKLAKNRGGTCLSNKYTNSQTKLKWNCCFGHKWEATPNNIARGEWCPHCNKAIRLNESKCRYILEKLTGEKFPSTRKILPSGLELDGYCRKLKLAFEYQGEQHYKIVKTFNMDQEKLNKIKMYDNEKVNICSEKKINLLVIPFTYSNNDKALLNFIVEELIRFGYFNVIFYYKFSFNEFYGKLPQLQELRELASLKGGKLISNEYLGCSYKLTFMCNKEHVWNVSPSDIKAGSWCPKCGMEKLKNSRRKSLNDMKYLAESLGGKCISRDYSGDKTKLLWQCSKGHEWWAMPSSINQGHWCPTCSKNKKLTLEQMIELANSKGGKCLSTQYINARTKLQWECINGHTWEATPYSIKQGTWCPRCKGHNKRNSPRSEKKSCSDVQ